MRIRGSGSKDFYAYKLEGEPLDVAGYRGVVDYEPSELVLTARAGTPLAEIEATLAKGGQMLACEPPYFGPNATLGGCVAAASPVRGALPPASVRDFVLGTRVLNGARRRPALRRSGDEERRRLRRVAPDGRFVRYAWRDPGGIAQGVADGPRRK